MSRAGCQSGMLFLNVSVLPATNSSALTPASASSRPGRACRVNPCSQSVVLGQLTGCSQSSIFEIPPGYLLKSTRFGLVPLELSDYKPHPTATHQPFLCDTCVHVVCPCPSPQVWSPPIDLFIYLFIFPPIDLKAVFHPLK